MKAYRKIIATMSATAALLALTACGSSETKQQTQAEEKPAVVDVEYTGSRDDGTVVTNLTDFDVQLHYNDGTVRGRTNADACKLENPTKLVQDESYRFRINCYGTVGEVTVDALAPANVRIDRAYALCDSKSGIMIGPSHNEDGTLRIASIGGSVDKQALSCVLEQMDAEEGVFATIESKIGEPGKYQTESNGAYYYWDIDDQGKLWMVMVGDFRGDYGTEVTQ